MSGVPITSVDFFCRSKPEGDRFALCVPNRDLTKGPNNLTNSFYAAVPAEGSVLAILSDIRSRFNNATGEIAQIDQRPGLFNLPQQGVLLFDVTNLLPEFIFKKNFKEEDYPGPNCFYSALASSGIITGDPRYVDDLELSYYLTLYFEPASGTDALKLGTIVLFNSISYRFAPKSPSETYTKYTLGTQRTRKFCRDTQGGDCYQLPLSHEHSKKSSRFYTRNPAQTLPPLYDAGEHAAFTLPSGFLMHKLSWRLDDRYEVVAFEEATKNLDYAAWSHADRFGRPDAPTYQKYSAVYFIKSASPHKTYEPIPMSESVKQGLLNIFSFYSNALESVRTANSDENFDHARLNLLSIDNAWQFLRDFGDKTLKSTPSNMLRLDKDVAAAYLKFHSLIWQYEAVKETFTKPDNEGNINESIRKRKELYKKHYLKDIDFLRAETYTHFAARGVPPEEMPALFDRLMARIKEQLPIVIDAAGSGEGMQFYKLLDETCR